MRPQTIKTLLASLLAAGFILGAGAAGAATTSIYPQSGPMEASPAGGQATQGQLAALQQQLDQARKERQALLQELQAVSRAKPQPTGDKARDQKALSDWQAKINSLQSKLNAKDAQIRALEARIANISQQNNRPRGMR